MSRDKRIYDYNRELKEDMKQSYPHWLKIMRAYYFNNKMLNYK